MRAVCRACSPRAGAYHNNTVVTDALHVTTHVLELQAVDDRDEVRSRQRGPGAVVLDRDVRAAAHLFGQLVGWLGCGVRRGGIVGLEARKRRRGKGKKPDP